jgi:Cellulase (glycosyl hydrolase family 5)
MPLRLTSRMSLHLARRRGGLGVRALPERAQIVGSQILDKNSVPLQLRGMNWGSFAESQPGDAADDVAQGATVVRVPLRWWGVYGAGIESRLDSATGTARINPTVLDRFDQDIAQLATAGLWILPFIDSNCGQSALQNAETVAYCDSTGPFAVNGRNFFTDPTERAHFIEVWKFMAQRLASVPRILAFELLPEPLDGRDATWSDDTRDFYRELIAAIRTVDTRTPFLVGPRDGYKIDNAAEALLPERTDCIYTGNMLNPVVQNVSLLPGRFKVLTDMRAASNVPILVQQLGRDSAADPDLSKFRASLSICNANKIHYTIWNKRDNGFSPTKYGQYYKDGAGGWIRKQNEWDLVAQYYAQTYNALRDAAHAAATAAGALLFYVLPNLSNVQQDAAGTIPVTAAGQPIGRISPVVGAGFTLQQATAASRPLLATNPNGFGWVPDAVDDQMQVSGNFFASGDDTVVIASGFVAAGNASRVIFHAGNATTNVRYPYLAISGADVPEASWRGDDTVLTGVTGTSTLDDTNCVLAAVKQGSDKRLLVFGAQEGATDTAAVGAIASFTRGRDSTSTTATAPYIGRRDFLCLGKTMTDPQIDAISKFAAFLSGSHYLA